MPPKIKDSEIHYHSYKTIDTEIENHCQWGFAKFLQTNQKYFIYNNLWISCGSKNCLLSVFSWLPN
ncbi:hypothetical protein NITGR_950055 [Nitrospina gracilis 3/211]|uniref:Uncharacterized protein n=1 Tax=Nitrospina gracilis (strain 3/211) TaxID=1266370 RepID=M1ZES9_NITG3|nr:hypothetical protein NITGR_950055 [Nitrospina gracilis 3/211]